jgi:hypothetical protein
MLISSPQAFSLSVLLRNRTCHFILLFFVFFFRFPSSSLNMLSPNQRYSCQVCNSQVNTIEQSKSQNLYARQNLRYSFLRTLNYHKAYFFLLCFLSSSTHSFRALIFAVSTSLSQRSLIAPYDQLHPQVHKHLRLQSRHFRNY